MMLQDRNPGYLDSKDGEQFKAYLAKRKIPYPKTEEAMYALIDKISGRR